MYLSCIDHLLEELHIRLLQYDTVLSQHVLNDEGKLTGVASDNNWYFDWVWTRMTDNPSITRPDAHDWENVAL